MKDMIEIKGKMMITKVDRCRILLKTEKCLNCLQRLKMLEKRKCMLDKVEKDVTEIKKEKKNITNVTIQRFLIMMGKCLDYIRRICKLKKGEIICQVN